MACLCVASPSVVRVQAIITLDQSRSASAVLFKELEDLTALEEKVRQAKAILLRRRRVASQRAHERMHVVVG